MTRGDLIMFLSRYQIPDEDDRQELYSGAMERLINTKLLMMFLARQQLPVSPEKIDEQVEQLKQDLKKDGQDLGMAIVQNNISMDNIRKEYEDRIRWQEYLKTEGDRRDACAGMSTITAISSAARSFGRATS